MSWTASLKRRKFIIIISLAFLLVTIKILDFIFWDWDGFEQTLFGARVAPEEASEEIQGVTKANLKEADYRELSPDQTMEAIRYQLSFNPEFHSEYYKDYYPNQTIIAIKRIEGEREAYIFTGDDFVGDPHWLGNEHVFFRTRCGTGCRGLYLASISREVHPGLLVTTPLTADSFETSFNDWFDRRHVFKGYAKNIRAETGGGESYLIFEMWNEDKPIGEKRFLFTGDSLQPLW